MDASDNKSIGTAVDIMAAVLNNMNKELPVTTSGAGKAGKRNPIELSDALDHLDDLERSDSGEGSEKKDESTEKKCTNTSNETAGSSCRDDSDVDNKLLGGYRHSSGCRDDSDVDTFVSASNKLIGYRYSVEELLEIASADCCKQRPESFANELFKLPMILRAPQHGATNGSTENVSLGRNNTPMDSNGPLLARMGNAGANGRGGGAAAFNSNRNGAGGGAGGGGRASGGFRGGEQDIILSPQIRSFNMGCQLPPATIPFPGGPGAGPNSVATAGGLLGDPGNNEGSTASAGRRIGSGRIMSRDERMSGGGGWNSDYKASGRDERGGGSDAYAEMDGDYHRGGNGRGGPGGGNSSNGPNKPNSRFFRMNDRREGGGGEQDGGHRGGYNNNNNYRNSNSHNNYGENGERGRGGYHRNHRYEQEEPEWFTGGPCSQLDTIELHGFDGPGQEEKEEGGGSGGRKFKRINEVEKEMKSKEEADQANERRRRGQTKEETTAEGGGKKKEEKPQPREAEKKAASAKESFAGQEEESALRKMVPTGSSPIKKGAGGQMDMRHFEDFLRLEDLLSSDDFEDAAGNFGGGGGNHNDENKRRGGQGGTSRFQQWFKSNDEAAVPHHHQHHPHQDGKISESVLNFMQTAKGGGAAAAAAASATHPQSHHQPDMADPNPVPRPPSSTSGTSEILSVKDLEASMQKKASNQPNQAAQQQFAHAPKVYGTGRLVVRMPNWMDKQQQQQQGKGGEEPQGNHHPQQHHMAAGPPNNNGTAGPEDMFAFQNFLAQISKPGGAQQQQAPPPGQQQQQQQQQQHQQPPMQQQGHPGMGKGMQPPPPPPGCAWGPDEVAANLKMLMHQHQQQQFLQENLNRQTHALALVKAAQAQAALRLSPNVFANHPQQQQQQQQPPQLTSPNNGPANGQMHLQPPLPPPGVAGLLPVVSPPKRIPSPRELQQHTQTIMQTALIRKKLQEQSENFRRRQEQLLKEHQQMPSANHKQMMGGDGCQPKMSSPTPAALAFTPTSVLRKMTAHGNVHGGGGGGMNAIGGGGAGNPGNQVGVGGGISPPLPSGGHGMVDIKIPTPQQGTVGGIVINNGEDLLRLKQSSMAGTGVPKCWSPPLPQMVGGGPQPMNNSNNIPTNNGLRIGRPIVKGGGGLEGGNVPPGGGGGGNQALNEYHMQQLHQQMLHQQRAMENQKMQHLFQQLQQQQQRNNLMMGNNNNNNDGGAPGGGGVQQRPFPQQQPQQMPPNAGQTGSQLRAIVGGGGGGGSSSGGGGSGAVGGASNLANLMYANQLQQQQQQQQHHQQPPQQNQGLNFMGVGGSRDGNLSPTSNQLARWFSPELLAKAQAGKLPSVNQPQTMLSLEEFERTISNAPAQQQQQPPIGIKRN